MVCPSETQNNKINTKINLTSPVCHSSAFYFLQSSFSNHLMSGNIKFCFALCKSLTHFYLLSAFCLCFLWRANLNCRPDCAITCALFVHLNTVSTYTYEHLRFSNTVLGSGLWRCNSIKTKTLGGRSIRQSRVTQTWGLRGLAESGSEEIVFELRSGERTEEVSGQWGNISWHFLYLWSLF